MPLTWTTPRPVYRPQSLVAQSKPTGHNNMALEHRSAPPVYRPGVATPQMKPGGLGVEQRPAPPIYRPSAVLGIQLHRVHVPELPVFTIQHTSLVQRVNVVQRAVAVAAVAAPPVAAPPDARVLRIRAEIAAAQAIVEQHRATIDGYSNGRNIQAGLRRGQLQTLIAALEATIPARQAVIDGHAAIPEPDPGNHQGAIRVNRRKLRAARADLGTLRMNAATAWAPDPNVPGREFRLLAHWDREVPVREARDIAADGGPAFQVVRRRR